MGKGSKYPSTLFYWLTMPLPLKQSYYYPWSLPNLSNMTLNWMENPKLTKITRFI